MSTPTRKRPRKTNGSTSSSSSAMRRTTSLSDLAPPPDLSGRPKTRAARGHAVAGPGTAWGAEMTMTHSADFLPAMETAAFLKACGICNRRLGPGRDTFIYMCVSLSAFFWPDLLRGLCFFLGMRSQPMFLLLVESLSACRSAACSFPPQQDRFSATAFVLMIVA
jgi:hypothetical protein